MGYKLSINITADAELEVTPEEIEEYLQDVLESSGLVARIRRVSAKVNESLSLVQPQPDKQHQDAYGEVFSQRRGRKLMRVSGDRF